MPDPLGSLAEQGTSIMRLRTIPLAAVWLLGFAPLLTDAVLAQVHPYIALGVGRGGLGWVYHVPDAPSLGRYGGTMLAARLGIQPSSRLGIAIAAVGVEVGPEQFGLLAPTLTLHLLRQRLSLSAGFGLSVAGNYPSALGSLTSGAGDGRLYRWKRGYLAEAAAVAPLWHGLSIGAMGGYGRSLGGLAAPNVDYDLWFVGLRAQWQR